MWTNAEVFWTLVFCASIFTSFGFICGGMMASAKRADEEMEREHIEVFGRGRDEQPQRHRFAQ